MLTPHQRMSTHASVDVKQISLDEINKTDDQGLSLLQIAAREGQFENVMQLLEKGADVNHVTVINNSTPLINKNSRKSALYFAIESHHYSIADLLVIAGADIGVTISIATELGDQAVVDKLHQLKINCSLLKAIMIRVCEINEVHALLLNNLMATLLKVINSRHEEAEERKENDEEDNNGITQQDVASFMEFAAYSNAFDRLEMLMQLGIPLRCHPGIRNVAYWLAIAKKFDVKLNDCDVELGLFQLEQDKQYDAFFAAFRNANEIQIQNYKKLSEKLSEVTDEKELILQQDWVSLSKKYKHQSSNDNFWMFSVLGFKTYLQMLKSPVEDQAAYLKTHLGLFVFTLSKKIQLGKIFDISSEEKTLLSQVELSQDKKIALIISILQERYVNFDLNQTGYRSILARICNVLTIPHGFVNEANYFSNLKEPAHHIIDCLNAFDQHQLEQVNTFFRQLTHDPAHRAKRLILREKGKLSAEYSQVCQQILLINQFFEDCEQEINRFGCFRFRNYGIDSTDRERIFWLVFCMIALSVTAPLFAMYEKEAKDIRDRMGNFVDSDGRNCLSYLSSSTTCNNYLLLKDASCKPFCDQLSAINPGDSVTFITMIVSSIIVFFLLCVALGSRTFRWRDASRFGDLPLKLFSPALQQLINELKLISDDDAGIKALTTDSAIKNIKTCLTAKLGIFETKMVNTAQQLEIQSAKLQPRVVIDVMDEEEEKEEERVPGLDQDDLRAGLLQPLRIN